MIYKTASTALPELCRDVLAGAELNSRAGWVKEQTFAHIGLTEPWRREILTPGRKASVVAQIAETLWVLAGRNDVEWLSAYLPRAKDFSDDGETWRAGYGPRIRGWAGLQTKVERGTEVKGEFHLDQLAEVVRKLSTISEDRRAVINLWDPAVDNEDSKDVPCNNWLHFLVRNGKLHLHVAIRSNDLMWGWSGINAFEWSALQELVASMIGAEVGELHFAISSLHLYQPYWAKAERITEAFQPGESSFADSPRAMVKTVTDLDEQLAEVFRIEGLLRKGWPFDLVHLTDPMLRSWVRVLAWHWTGSGVYLEPLQGTRLYAATREMPVVKPSAAEEFAEWAAKLHAEKHAVYGDSWKKRGEQVSIQANIARKIDRLGKAGAGDTELDTTTDLLVYLVKYGLWLRNPKRTDEPVHVADVRDHLLGLARTARPLDNSKSCEISLTVTFEELLRAHDKDRVVENMEVNAFALALHHYTESRKAPTGLGQTHAERNATRMWNPGEALV